MAGKWGQTVIKRIRIRRRDSTAIATPAIKPLFEEMSLVRYKTVDDSTGPAYWPDAFLVMEVEAAAKEDPEEDATPHAPGQFNLYVIKSIVTGQTETVYQGDLQAVSTKYLEFIIEYYTAALRKFRTHRRSTADYVDSERETSADRPIRAAAATARHRALSDDEGDEAIPEPEESVEEEEEVPAPLRRIIPEIILDDDQGNEPEDRHYVPRARRGY